MAIAEEEISFLIEGCKKNDRKAQQLLYKQFYTFAMAIAMRYSRDDTDAADILSHAFVKVFKHIHTFDASKGNLHGWIKTIVINEGLSHIKARHKFSYDIAIENITEPLVDNSIISKINTADLMSMIQQLPPATHAVFVLYAVEGYAHKEIATELKISEGTSKWHVSEAKKTLQQKIMLLQK